MSSPGGGVGGRGGQIGGLGSGSDPTLCETGRGSNGTIWLGKSVRRDGGVDGLAGPRDSAGGGVGLNDRGAGGSAELPRGDDMVAVVVVAVGVEEVKRSLRGKKRNGHREYRWVLRWELR